MANANYRKGVRLENLLKAQLERGGYDVMRSAGSKGAVDLAAWNGTELLLIQVKSEGAKRQVDLDKLKKVKCPAWGRRLLYERDGGLTEWTIFQV